MTKFRDEFNDEHFPKFYAHDDGFIYIRIARHFDRTLVVSHNIHKIRSRGKILRHLVLRVPDKALGRNYSLYLAVGRTAQLEIQQRLEELINE